MIHFLKTWLVVVLGFAQVTLLVYDIVNHQLDGASAVVMILTSVLIALIITFRSGEYSTNGTRKSAGK